MSSILKTGLVILILVSIGSLSLAQGKPLFKYPNEHPVYIITYTKQDLEKIRQDRFMHDLKNATFSRRTASPLLPVEAD